MSELKENPEKIAPPMYTGPGYPEMPGSDIVKNQPGKIIEMQHSGDLMSDVSIRKFLDRLGASKDLFMEQRYQLCEILFNWNQENKFYVWQDRDSAPFYAREKSSCLCRQFCGDRRSFGLGIKDALGNVLLKVERPFNCSMFCGSIFPDSIVIKLGNEQIIGYVKERVNIVPHFAIKNPQGQTMFHLKSRFIPATFHSNDKVKFTVYDSQQNKIASIIKHWSGCATEWFTSCDKFTIEFGLDWTPELKALLLGTLFLINMRHYENQCCSPALLALQLCQLQVSRR